MSENLTPTDEEVEAVAAAIDRARCAGREGPYGGYDYSGYGVSKPYVVRDFRDPASDAYGSAVFESDDRSEAEAVFEQLTQSHIARAAIEALDAVRGKA
jgi:lysozyme family protein